AWMTATKVLTDSLATGFLSVEILAALYFSRRGNVASLLTAAICGAAACGTRPQLFLVALAILIIALKPHRAEARTAVLGLTGFVGGCLLWLLPMWYQLWRLRPDVPFLDVYPKL